MFCDHVHHTHGLHSLVPASHASPTFMLLLLHIAKDCSQFSIAKAGAGVQA